MNGFAHQPHPFDVFMLISSVAFIGWMLVLQ
jgi:hypothetical protein